MTAKANSQGRKNSRRSVYGAYTKVTVLQVD